MMKRMAKALLMVLAFDVSLSAQALAPGRAPATRLMLDSGIGYDGIGFKNPHVVFGASLEQAMGERVELQGGVSFSPNLKLTTNDDKSILVTGMGLFWITHRLAVTGGFTRANLLGSQPSKIDWMPSVGIGMRDHLFSFPGRLYLSYVFPTGCQWGANCPIQSIRILGPQGYWEHRIWPHLRLGMQVSYYRILNQGNPLDPASGRTGEWKGDVRMLMRFEFPGDSRNTTY
jgi:hypothetical protein